MTFRAEQVFELLCLVQPSTPGMAQERAREIARILGFSRHAALAAAASYIQQKELKEST